MRSRPGLFRNLVAVFVSFSFIFFFKVTTAYSEIPEAEWMWDILVVPPDEGWETETGIAIRRTLLWHQAEVADRPDGVKGHDVNFVFLPSLSEDSVRGYVLPITPATIAVFSFASHPVDRLLLQSMTGRGIPLLLAGGENVFLFESDRLLPFAFALDLFRDYRARAFTEYAKKTLPAQTRLGIIGARFTLHEEREARVCYDLLVEGNFMPLPFWITASARDVFSMVEQEIKSATQGVLISYIGSMGTKELWQGMVGRYAPQHRLWFGGAPDPSFSSFKSMIFADQNMHLDTRGGFEQLRRNLWSTRAMAIKNEVSAGRANALALWLERALNALPLGWTPRDRDALLRELGQVQGIPFGNQILGINPSTHRPDHRAVRILEVRNREFFVVDTLNVQGLGYFSY